MPGRSPSTSLKLFSGPSTSISAETSVPTTPTGDPASSTTVLRAGDAAGSRTGASLTERTVTLNVWLNVALSPVVARSPSRPPSSTVTVMVAVPCWSPAGVTAMVPVASGDA